MAAITDGQTVTKVTMFEEFASKVQQGGSYIMRGYELRGTASPYNINITARTQFFRAPTLSVREDLFTEAQDLLHPPVPLTPLKMSSTNGGLITATCGGGKYLWFHHNLHGFRFPNNPLLRVLFTVKNNLDFCCQAETRR